MIATLRVMAAEHEDIARKAYGGTLPTYQRAEITLACGVKRCSLCREWLPLNAFGAAADRGDGLNNKCRACANGYQAEWHDRPGNERKRADYTRRSRAADPVRTRRNRLAARCKAYGITVERYEALLAEQGGQCGMCGMLEGENGKLFAVDHDHACCPDSCRSCGECVRGLLCDLCNRALGFIESPAYMANARRYLVRKGDNPVGKG